MDDFQIMLYVAAIIVCVFSIYSIVAMLSGMCPIGEEKVCIRDGQSHISCFCVKKIIGGD